MYYENYLPTVGLDWAKEAPEYLEESKEMREYLNSKSLAEWGKEAMDYVKVKDLDDAAWENMRNSWVKAK